MASPLHRLEILSNGKIKDYPDWLIPPEPGLKLARLRINDPPRYNDVLPCPPAVNVFYVDCSLLHGGIRTDIDRYGWLDYLKKLNGDKWEQSMDRNLAIFNNKTGEDTTMMQSLGFDCNLFWLKETDKWDWAQVWTLDYYNGPPEGMPTFEENPVFVQKSTAQCRLGAIISHKNNFTYPVVHKQPIYCKWDKFELYSPNMKTPPPPTYNPLRYFVSSIVGRFIARIRV